MLKARAQSDEDPIVRRTAVQELARRWRHDAETAAILKVRAESDHDPDVRRTAARELARR
jgi:hypothetical protein